VRNFAGSRGSIVITLTTSKARQDLSSVIKDVRKGERFLLSRHGVGVAAVVSVEDLALLQAIEDRRDARAVQSALTDAEKRHHPVGSDQGRARALTGGRRLSN
jgi:prevent-host-death family protein